VTSGHLARAAPANTGGEARGARGRVRFARVLEEDPGLGDGLDAAQLATATEVARAAVVQLSPGEWQPETWPTSVRSGFGLLVLDGLLLRRVRLGDRFGVELLSSGDLLRPWQREDAVSSVPRHLGWQVSNRAASRYSTSTLRGGLARYRRSRRSSSPAQSAAHAISQ